MSLPAPDGATPGWRSAPTPCAPTRASPPAGTGGTAAGPGTLTATRDDPTAARRIRLGSEKNNFTIVRSENNSQYLCCLPVLQIRILPVLTQYHAMKHYRVIPRLKLKIWKL